MAFTPDGRYFLAGRPTVSGYGNGHAQQDQRSGSVKDLLSHSFSFQGNDRLWASRRWKKIPAKRMRQCEVPSGRCLSFCDRHHAILRRQRGDYVIARPLPKFAAGIYDLKENKIKRGIKTPAVDVFDDQYLSERKDAK